MKKLFAIILCFAGLTNAADAQQIYFRGGLGYAFPHAGAVQGPIFSYSTNSFFPGNGSYSGTYLPTNNSESFDMKKVSYTAGVQGILALGVMLNKNIGVEMGANIGLGPKKMATSLYSESVEVKTWLDANQQTDMPVMLTPALVLQTGGDKIKLYARGGIVLPVQAAITQEIQFTQDRFNIADSTYVRRTVGLTEEFRMRFNPGFSGAMGVKYKTGKQVTLWAEASMLSMSLYYKSSELIMLTENGVGVLGQLTPEEKTTRYEFEGNINGNSNIVPTLQAPFSNFSINAGVAIGF